MYRSASVLKPWEEAVEKLKEKKGGTYAVKWAVWNDEFYGTDVEMFPYDMATSRASDFVKYHNPQKIFSTEKAKNDFLDTANNFIVFENGSVWFKIWIAVPIIFRLEDLNSETRRRIETCELYCPFDLAKEIPTWAAEFNRYKFIVNDK